jgi:hypothetical protein
MWATEIELGLQGSDASFALFHFLMDGVLDRDTGKYVLRRDAAVELDNGSSRGLLGNDSISASKVVEAKETVDGLDQSVSATSDVTSSEEGQEKSVEVAHGGTGSDAELAQRSLVSEVSSLLGHVEKEQKQRRVEDSKLAPGSRIHEGDDQGNADTPPEFRSYIYIDVLHHPNLAAQQYRSFFSACRRQGIAFDLEARSGLAFLLLDSIASGVLGAMAVGSSYHHALDSIFGCLSFVLQQAGVAPRVRDDSTDIGLTRVHGRVKQLRSAETERIQQALKEKRFQQFANRGKKNRAMGLSLPES